ncbi:hypothetical protein C0Q70_03109 [Pomacea canaliculata]|uniref:Uncharacterized protein n=1 Tax=Pomacea canaliculata TaxID=400727 RepID=A0A2T7PRT6_POMCA|nr:hypothetical protein C0Q70_03109 [Pomacea canaliculata]
MTNVTAIVVSVVLALIGIGICVFIISRIKARRDLGERDWIISANKLYSAPIVEGKAGAITGSTKQWLRKETKGFRGRLWSLVSQDSFKGFGGNAFTKHRYYPILLILILILFLHLLLLLLLFIISTVTLSIRGVQEDTCKKEGSTEMASPCHCRWR